MVARPKSLRVVGFCVFAALGGALFGYDIGVISSCFTMPDFIERFGESDGNGGYYLSSNRQSIITSLLGAGTFFGSIIQAFTADLKWGRRGSLFFWSVVFSIGCIIQVASMSGIGQITAGRFIAGLGVGALSALVPLYNGEAAPKDLRGPLVVLYQVMVTAGLLWAYGLDWITHSINGPASWRVPVGFQLVFGGVLCIGSLFLPESPRHLLNYNNPDGARRSIAKMNNCSTDDPLVAETMGDLELMLELENEGGKASWFELLSTNHAMWKRTANACILQFVQQLNGQNFYYYYGPSFFAQSGTGLSTYAIQFLLGAVTFAATLPAMYFIERLGRRKMLFIGSAGEITCALIAAFAGHFMLASTDTPADQYTKKNTTGGQLLIAFAIIQIAFFGSFWGPVPWVISSESFPLRVRSKGIAVATATNWLWNFLLGFFSARIADDIGTLILLIFAGVLLFGVVYIYFMLPETKGLSLEQIDELYTLKIKPWKSAGWVPPAHEDAPRYNDKGEIVHQERKRAPATMTMGH